MHLYFDESGDFAFPEDRFDAYVQAALICPDSFVEKIEHYIANKNRELGVDELHAAALPDEELGPICQFLAGGPLSMLAQATDSQVMNAGAIAAHREAQARQLAQNLEHYQRAGGQWPDAADWYKQRIKRADLASRVSNVEYVQADLLVGLIYTALFKSIVRYVDDAWRDDLVDFHFILDGKLPGKLAAGEKELNVILMPRLGSNDYAMVVPTTWQQEPLHPFIAKFGSGDDKLSLNRVFEHGLRFAPSHEHAGLQLVDTIAYVTRRAILESDNQVIHRAYAHLRDLLRTERGGQAVRLVRYDEGQDSVDDQRYRSVV